MSFNVSLSISSTGNAPKEREKRKKKKKSIHEEVIHGWSLTFDNLIIVSKTMISNDRILDLYPKGVFSCILTPYLKIFK